MGTAERLKNLAEMLINFSSNIADDMQSISDMFEFAGEALADNDATRWAKGSLERSKICFEGCNLSTVIDAYGRRIYPNIREKAISDSVETLGAGVKEDFLIFPLYSKNHAFNVVIRKMGKDRFGNEIYSVVIPNTGGEGV